MADGTRGRRSKHTLIGACCGVVALIVASIWLMQHDAGGEEPLVWWRTGLRTVLSLLCLGVGALSLAGRATDRRAQLLATLFFAIAFEFAMPDPRVEGSFWFIAAGFAYYLFTGMEFAVELHLASIIPEQRRRSRVAVATLYAVGAGVAVIGCSTYAGELWGRTPFPWTVEQFDDALHAVLLPVWAIALVSLLGATTWRWPERLGRLQSGLVLLGVLPWAAYVISSWALGYPGRYEMTLIDELVPLFLLCYPVAVFVAVFRYRLLDLESIVRRSLIYTVLTGAAILAFYALLGLGSALLAHVIGDDVGSIWLIAAVTVLLGLISSPVLRATQAAIDRRFFPERAMMREHLTSLAVELPTLGQPDRMARRLVEELRRIFIVDSASLFVFDLPPRLSCLAAVGRGADLLPPTIPADDPIVDRLTRWARPATIEQVTGDSASFAKHLHSAGARLIVPLCFEGRLIGLLLMGEKPAARRFTLEERELLALVGHLGAAVFDNARLAYAAKHEELTGLMRREAILAVLRREIERAQRYGRPLTIALADVDHFKSVNDSYGHATGDRVLRRVADAMARRLRQSDGIGRYGGEEFLCVFPETDGAHGDRLAEKLRSAVEAVGVHSDDGTRIEVSISVGVAELSELSSGADLPRRLVAAADGALYRAKAAGRNRIERHRRELAGSA